MAGVAAGLYIEIAADIVRLQKDLDTAKRQVRAASRDIGNSAKAANDNLAGMGRSMGNVSTMSRSMRANMINLGRQVQDVGTMFAMGADPMQIFASQGAQVADVLVMMNAEAKATNTSLSRMAMGGLARLGPYALAAAAAAGVLAGGVAHMRDEVNRTSDVTVTMGDVVLGTFDAIAAGARNTVTDAFEQMGIDVSAVWNGIRDVLVMVGNQIIGVATYLPRAILAGWNDFPGAMADLFYTVLNTAIGVAEQIANAFITAGNMAKAASNEFLGTDFSQGAIISLERFQSEYAGRFGSFMAEQLQVAGETFTRDFIGEFTEYSSPFIQERARARIEAEAEETGRRAGRAMGRSAAEEMAKELARLELTRLEKAEAAQQRLLDKQKEYAEELARLEEERREEEERAAEDAFRREQDQIRDLAGLYEELFTGGIDNLWDVFEKQGIAVISNLAAQWTLSLLSGNPISGNAMGGAMAQSPLGSIFQTVFGGTGGAPIAANDNGTTYAQGAGGNPWAPPGWEGPAGTTPSLLGIQGVSLGSTILGAGLGGAIGGNGGLFGSVGSIGGSIGGQIIGKGLSFLGSLGGPLGAIAGGLFGNLVGGLIDGIIGGSDRGAAIISGGRVSGFYGDTQEYKDQAGGLAGNVLSAIQQIADALGADYNASAGRVSIGIRDGNYVVDPQGRGYTKTSKFPDLMAFGQDAEAAVAAAIADLLKDGVIGGISQASQNLLRQGGDLEAQLEKALLIESIPKLLKEQISPLDAALSEIDAQFQKLADALREGGATAQQFADAEKLYNLERQQAADQFGRGIEQLQEYLDSLAFGSNSPLSVRSQLQSARSSFADFEQAILAGETVDQSAFINSAQTLLGLSRQANASSSGFFSDFDRIRELTQMAIENADTGALADGSVVFAQQTAANTRAQALMQEDTNALLRDIRDRLSSTGYTPTSSGTFIGSDRAFAA